MRRPTEASRRLESPVLSQNTGTTKIPSRLCTLDMHTQGTSLLRACRPEFHLTQMLPAPEPNLQNAAENAGITRQPGFRNLCATSRHKLVGTFRVSGYSRFSIN